LTYFAPDGRAARAADQLLDLLLLATLLAAPLVFYTRGYDVFEFNKITVLRALCSLAAVTLLFKLLFVRPLALTRSALDLPVLAWLGVCLVATFKTVSWRLSVHGVYEDFEGITTWVMYVFMFWWALQHVRTERQIRLVLGTVVLAGTVAGFYGLLQNFGIDFVPWNPDTYNPTRMFSTMGNPNFLAAYTVMSMPITFVIFLDLPERIRTDRRLNMVLVVLGLLASAFLCTLFKADYFDFDPAHFGATSLAGLLVSQKFLITKVLLAFPLICALLLTWGRLRWILLLSLLGQLVSTLYTKSRGGVFSMAALALLFGGAMAWELGRARGVVMLLAALGTLTLAVARDWWLPVYDIFFTQQRFLSLLLFGGLLLGLRWLLGRRPGAGVLRRNHNLDYVMVLLLVTWAAHSMPEIRDTTFQMLERVSKLFHPSEVRETPRLFIWRSALNMLKDDFWFGKGLDTFQISFPPYRVARYWILEWNGTPEKAHNFIMQTAATMGFMGLVAFAWMHLAWGFASFRDWRRQIDERRQWLLLAGFGAWLGFFVQNLFSFTVVGYGSLWWVLWGLVPAMARTWDGEAAAAAPVAAPGFGTSAGAWGSPRAAWAGGVTVFSAALLACALGGPFFFSSPDAVELRAILAGAGVVALLYLLVQRRREAPGLAELVLLGACAAGAFFFSFYSVRTWVGDSFYKQGQVGMNVGQAAYAEAMDQIAAGRLAGVSQQQLEDIHHPDVVPSRLLQILPGLNPDQELYWVKMGIAFEGAAGAATKPEDQLLYYRTALAIHHYTLQMNPINGYNYNNKGRVLKAMGEKFGQPKYLELALDHYKRAVALDKNNVYFSLDEAATLLDLGRNAEALDVCQKLQETFPDFALPYSYAAFIKMRAGQTQEAMAYFQKAVASDWKTDYASKALAAANLGLLQEAAHKPADAEASFSTALQVNPAMPEAALHLAQLQAKAGLRPQAAATLRAFLAASPGNADAVAALKRLGAQP
jgi:tetratricopeptide (TPR) repeat protein